jgi:radical SAM protein with 4Fe4S-binding SPASM domain
VNESPAFRHRGPGSTSHALFLAPGASVVWAEDGFQLSIAGTEVRHPLSPAEALALLLLGRIGALDAVRAHLKPLGPAFTFALDYVTRRFPTYLGPGAPRSFEAAWWGEKVRYAKVREGQREAAPAAVTWVVTLECNRRCPYCFYKIIAVSGEHRHRPRDATFSTENALRTIAEMGRIGTADLYLTGGEPLLRDDLPELIAAAADLRIRPHVVTKYAIDRGLAERLAQSRLHHITISLDDLRNSTASRLTGVEEYPAQALASIEHALEAGLKVEVNAVLTSLNQEGLEPLARRLVEMGVPNLTISPLQEPYFRNANVGRLLTDARLDPILDQIREAVGDRMTVERGGASTSEQGTGLGCGPDLVCEVGMRSLHILPNGDVTRCHYLPDRSDLIAGSLELKTLVQIWNGPALSSLVDPSPRDYAGTACHGCGGFAKCNSRGRCVASALLEHQKIFAPDAFCARGP